MDSIINCYSNGNIEDIERFKYNPQGAMVEKIRLNGYRKILMKQTIEYDKHYFKIRTTTKEGTGQKVSMELTKYLFKDSNHYIYTNSYFDLKNKINQDIIFRLSFSENGDVIDKTTEYPKRPIFSTKIKYFYNAENQVVRKTIEQTNTHVFSEQKMEYDASGNMVKFSETVPINTIFNIYEYNETGDWTKRISKGKLTDKATGLLKNSLTITVRDIKYY